MADVEMRKTYTVKETTTTTTKTANFVTSPRPVSLGHSVIINRTIASPGRSSGQRSITVEKRSLGSAGHQPFEEGKYVAETVTGVNEVKSSREQERKDMQDLNSRFANYLDRVRSLELRNKALAEELGRLKAKWGRETIQIKAMYQAELDEARHDLDESLKEKARLQIKSTSLQEEIEFVSMQVTELLHLTAINEETLKFQIQRIIEYEREIELLRRTIADLEKDREKNRGLILQLEATLTQTRQNLDDETLGHVSTQNRIQTIEEEIEFLKKVHEQEMKELGGLILSGSSADNRDYWKTQMADAIREIEQMYEEKMTTIRTDLETHYNTKINEVKEQVEKEKLGTERTTGESSEMKVELTDLRKKLGDLTDQNSQLQRELDLLMRQKEERERDLEQRNAELRADASSTRMELDNILRQVTLLVNLKNSLELEIAAYRKLLEAEETRLDSKYGKDGMVNGTNEEEDSFTSVSGELRAKTNYQTSAKGSLSISECSPDGNRVQVENKGSKIENLRGWKIDRTVDGRPAEEFVFADSLYERLTPGQKVNVWAHGKKPRGAHVLDTEIPSDTWGVGIKVTTKLFNSEGEERATHNQTTVYTRKS